MSRAPRQTFLLSYERWTISSSTGTSTDVQYPTIAFFRKQVVLAPRDSLRPNDDVISNQPERFPEAHSFRWSRRDETRWRSIYRSAAVKVRYILLGLSTPSRQTRHRLKSSSRSVSGSLDAEVSKPFATSSRGLLLPAQFEILLSPPQ
jgi:hypothetical protein